MAAEVFPLAVAFGHGGAELRQVLDASLAALHGLFSGSTVGD